MKGVNIRRIFLYVLIASVALSTVIGIVVVLFGDFGNFEVRVLMTTLTVTVTSILGLACGAYFESGRGRLLPLTGIVFSVTAAVMTFFIIWNVFDDSEVFIKSTATVTLLALSFSHLSLLSLARLDRRFAWSLIAAFVCVSLLAVILLYIMWVEPDASGDLVTRIIGVLSILVAAVTVMTPVFHKLSSGTTKIAGIDAEIEKLRSKLTELENRKAELSQSVSDE